MKIYLKYALFSLWASSSAFAAGVNQIRPISDRQLRSNDVNRIDLSSIQRNLKEVFSIELQLYSNEPSRIFRRKLTDTEGWVGTDSDENTMKLTENDGSFQGSVTFEDKVVHINSNSDGTGTFEEASNEEFAASLWDTSNAAPEDRMDATTSNAVPFVLSLTSDDFGTEIKWTLSDEKDFMETGGPYVGSSNTYSHETQLDASRCYTFTIYDTGHDGICCDFGHGDYSISYDGAVVAKMSEKYKTTESHKFGNCGDSKKLLGFIPNPFVKSKSEISEFENSDLPCKSWCSENNVPWKADAGEAQKCDWQNTCAGCRECFHSSASGLFEGNDDRLDFLSFNPLNWFKKKQPDSTPPAVSTPPANTTTPANTTMPGNSTNATATEFEGDNERVDFLSLNPMNWGKDKPNATESENKTSVLGSVGSALNPMNWFGKGNSTNATATEFENEASLKTSETCKDWCHEIRDIPWNSEQVGVDHKCSWAAHCSGCAECFEDEE